MSDNKQRNDDVSTQSIVMLLICGLLVYVGSHINKIEAWAKDHWFFLAILGVATAWGIKSFLTWKFRMKHPEAYERQMALEKMKRRGQYDE
jgi:hypothetical protein